MTQFSHTLKPLLEGRKTETSRSFYRHQGIYLCIGQDYAIQPSRRAKSLGRFMVDEIHLADVRDLTPAQVEAEGFDSLGEFLAVWVWDNDMQARRYYARGGDDLVAFCTFRPVEYYLANRYTIHVLWETVDWERPEIKALGIQKPDLGAS